MVKGHSLHTLDDSFLYAMCLSILLVCTVYICELAVYLVSVEAQRGVRSSKSSHVCARNQTQVLKSTRVANALYFSSPEKKTFVNKKKKKFDRVWFSKRSHSRCVINEV